MVVATKAIRYGYFDFRAAITNVLQFMRYGSHDQLINNNNRIA
jgi:hypothetical protein